MRDKRKRSPFNRPLFLVWLVLIIVGTSCNLPMQSREIRQVDTATPGVVLPSATVSRQPTHTPTPASTPTLVQTPTPTPVPSPTRTATLALTDASTHTPTETPTATITPTYAILRGKVLAQSNCRYGPGAPYLYKYGLYPGSNLEIIGRNELGTWILVQAIGGHNPCWVKASLMEIKGDVMSVAPASLPLPQSPYYGPPAAVSAVRKGNDVIISWIGIALRAGDDSEQFPYLIEAWVCQSGQQIFTPVGSYATIVTIQDEPGCFEQSHGRLYAVEKHGYTEWVAIPWPPP